MGQFDGDESESAVTRGRIPGALGSATAYCNPAFGFTSPGNGNHHSAALYAVPSEATGAEYIVVDAHLRITLSHQQISEIVANMASSYQASTVTSKNQIKQAIHSMLPYVAPFCGAVDSRLPPDLCPDAIIAALSHLGRSPTSYDLAGALYNQILVKSGNVPDCSRYYKLLHDHLFGENEYLAPQQMQMDDSYYLLPIASSSNHLSDRTYDNSATVYATYASASAAQADQSIYALPCSQAETDYLASVPEDYRQTVYRIHDYSNILMNKPSELLDCIAAYGMLKNMKEVCLDQSVGPHVNDENVYAAFLDPRLALPNGFLALSNDQISQLKQDALHLWRSLSSIEDCSYDNSTAALKEFIKQMVLYYRGQPMSSNGFPATPNRVYLQSRIPLPTHHPQGQSVPALLLGKAQDNERFQYRLVFVEGDLNPPTIVNRFSISAESHYSSVVDEDFIEALESDGYANCIDVAINTAGIEPSQAHATYEYDSSCLVNDADLARFTSLISADPDKNEFNPAYGSDASKIDSPSLMARIFCCCCSVWMVENWYHENDHKRNAFRLSIVTATVVTVIIIPILLYLSLSNHFSSSGQAGLVESSTTQLPESVHPSEVIVSPLGSLMVPNSTSAAGTSDSNDTLATIALNASSDVTSTGLSSLVTTLLPSVTSLLTSSLFTRLTTLTSTLTSTPTTTLPTTPTTTPTSTPSSSGTITDTSTGATTPTLQKISSTTTTLKATPKATQKPPPQNCDDCAGLSGAAFSDCVLTHCR